MKRKTALRSLIRALVRGAASILSSVIVGRRQSPWHALSSKLLDICGAFPPTIAASSLHVRLAWQVEQISLRLSALDHRSAQLHGVSGLPTREPLMEAIDRPGVVGCLCLIELCDFDRLSLIDACAAEQVLKQFADRIVRMSGPGRFLAHVDRTRFAIWCPRADRATAQVELNAICYALQARIQVPGVDFVPQIRSSLVESAAGHGDAAAMIAHGLVSLSSLHNATLADSSDKPSPRDLFLLEQDLRHAMHKNELRLWYQPFIDAANQRICGAEALLRWQHPVHGTISPMVFIPLMEQIGLAGEIGLWTLNAGCREAKSWCVDDGPSLKIAINLSAHQLERDDLDLMVERTLRRHGLAPSLLELELTETVASVDSARARDLFDRLRNLGVTISIDDFGAGYSSLSYLKKLAFDKIKIDREFVSHVERQRDSQAICQSIIALGRGLGLPVLAEGIERAEEFGWLRRHGCQFFQGYYFSRPLESSAFLPLIRDQAQIRTLTDLSPAALQQRAMMSHL